MLYRKAEYSEIAGTSFWGDEILATKDFLTRIFGEPSIIDDGKVMYEWALVIDNVPFTIYDWKEKHYFTDNYQIYWHIGAKDAETSHKAFCKLNILWQENREN